MSLQSVDPIALDFFKKPIVIEESSKLLSSDGGLLPLRQFDERIGLTRRFAKAIHDARSGRAVHTVLEMSRMRIYGILAGYEDQNDHDTLRYDPVFQLLANQLPGELPLASQPTLSRFENSVSVSDLKRLREVLVEQWLDSFDEPPRQVTLDIDAVDDPTHGEQQLTMFHGYYDQHQYLPLLISHAESEMFVWVSLRPGAVHPAHAADEALEYVVTRLRQRFPDVQVTARGDCGYGVPKMYHACERLDTRFTFGLSGNAKLRKMTDELLAEAERRYKETKQPQRLFAVFPYKAGSWPRERCVIAKVERNHQGTNRRFIVTDRAGAAIVPEAAYDDYVMRGEAENRNKEIKTGLAMDRLSDHRFMANYFRLFLHTAALNLMVLFRRGLRLPPRPSRDPEIVADALTGRERRNHQRRYRESDPLGRAQPCTWRTRLIKVAAEVIVSARRIVIRLAPHWPYLQLYDRAARFALSLTNL